MMLQAFHSFIHHLPAISQRSSCSFRTSLHRFYSSSLKEPRQRDWRSAGHPNPLSLVQGEDEPLDLSEDDDEPPPRPRKYATQDETPNEWRQHRLTLKEAFPDGWKPPRKISREAMDGLRTLHMYDKDMFSTPVLADKFRISPEAVRRILRSKWEPTREKRVKMAERERRTREERILKNRLEEKKQKLELILGTAKDGMDRAKPMQKDRFTRGVNSGDELYFQ